MKKSHIIGHDVQRHYIQLMKEKGKMHHALHFSGMAGIGKRILAMELLQGHICETSSRPMEACGQCRSCITFAAGTHGDVCIIEPDEKGSIKIGTTGDNPQPGTIRWLINRLSQSSIYGKYAVLIDGMDLVTGEGQNALLKILEEPPAGTLVVVVSSFCSQVLPTIRSRTQEIMFNPLHEEQVLQILEQFDHDNENRLVARLSSGSMSMAMALKESDFYRSIMDVAEEIKLYYEQGVFPSFEAMDGARSRGDAAFIDAMTGVYRIMFIDAIAGGQSMLPGEIFINDIDRIGSVLKIIQSLRKGLARNLNLKTILKGMIYNSNSPWIPGIPEPGLSYQGAAASWK